MFSIDNILFLLTTAEEFSLIQQQRLIIPGVIFSIGAIMLIVCVLVSNIQRRKKLANAERLKRERIKKFSEEANMRYSAPETDVTLRQKKIVTESIPANSAPIVSMQRQTNSAPVMPNAQVTPVMPGTQPPVSMPVQMQTPQQKNVMPAPTVAPAPTPAPVPVQAPAPTPVMPAQTSAPVQPSMGGTPLPGMNSGYVPTSDDIKPKQEENLADVVRKRIQEIEDKKRNELAEANRDTNVVTPQVPTKPQTDDVKPAPTVQTQTEEKPKEEKKEFKFEYKPDYKPGQEPSSEEKIKIPLKKEEVKEEIKEENKNEKVEEQKAEIVKTEEVKKEEKIESKIEKQEENKQEEKLITTKIKTISIDAEDKINDEIKQETKEETKEDKIQIEETPITKAPKVIVERSSEFYEAEEKEKQAVNVLNEEEKQKQNDRVPQVPKIKSKKIEYNVGYLREVQNKLNSSREYEEAIAFKEEEKNKLKEELLEKRMNLEKVKSKLQTEKQQAEENKKITKEEISKSLLENTEIGIVYEEGKKVSLFDVDNVDNSLNENKKVEVKLEQPKQVEKVEEKIDIKSKEIISETKKEIIKELPKEKEISEAKELIQKVSEKEIREKKQSEVFNQLDALFSGTDEAEDNSSRDYDIKQKLKEKFLRENQKNKLKEIVKETKKEELVSETTQKVSLASEEDVAKVKANMETIAAAAQITKQVNNITSQNNSDETDDPIRARIRAKVEEERKKKEELLRQEKEAREEKLKERENQKTKSILNGVDIEQEILQTKANKKVTSFDDAPDYKKIISVISPESCGKTTIATNLAYELANKGLKVCLIDTDNIKKDVYYYINEEKVGCLSKLNDFEEVEDMYKLGINVNDRLTVFTENKGIEFEINYSKLYKLISYAQRKNDAVIIDVKQTLGQEKVKDILKLSTNILFVIDKKITTLNRIAEKFAKVKGGFVNKDVTVVVNMDEGRGINKSAVKSIFKHLEYIDNGEKKSYAIRIGDIYTVAYDTKSIITGLISQLPAVTVPENKIIPDMKNIASHFFETIK